MPKLTLTDDERRVLGAIRVMIGKGSHCRVDLSLLSIITGISVSRIKTCTTSLIVGRRCVVYKSLNGRHTYAITNIGSKELPERDVQIDIYKQLVAYKKRSEQEMARKPEKTTKKVPAKKAAAKKAVAKKEPAKKPRKVKSKVPTEERNGIKPPGRGASHAMWEIIYKLRGRKKGAPDINDYLVECESEGFALSTARVIFSKWKKYHGV